MAYPTSYFLEVQRQGRVEKPLENKWRKIHWREKRGYFCQQWTLNQVLTCQDLHSKHGQLVWSEDFSKRHNHSDKLFALSRAQPSGMLGTAASTGFSATFSCAIKYVSCLQGILLRDISNSNSNIGIWVDYDCLSTQNADFNPEKRDSFCFDHMLWKVWHCIQMLSPSPNRKLSHLSLHKGLNQEGFLTCSGKMWSEQGSLDIISNSWRNFHTVSSSFKNGLIKQLVLLCHLGVFSLPESWVNDLLYHLFHCPQSDKTNVDSDCCCSKH